MLEADSSTYRFDGASSYKKRGGLNNTLLTDKTRFQCKEDLEIYAKNVLGQEELTTFIVPDIQQILDNIRETKMKMNTRDAIKDEFEHMINWKRVFEHIWT